MISVSNLYIEEDNFVIAGKLKYWFYHGLKFVKDDMEMCSKASVGFFSPLLYEIICLFGEQRPPLYWFFLTFCPLDVFCSFICSNTNRTQYSDTSGILMLRGKEALNDNTTPSFHNYCVTVYVPVLLCQHVF